MGFSLGGSSSSTKTNSTASSLDLSQSNQSVFGADLFQQLYGDAFGATGKVAANLPTYQGDAATLFSGGKDFLASLGGDAGTGYLTDRLSGNNDILNQQISGLGSDLSKFYKEQLLPGITSDSIMGGNFGGDRQGVAQGAAAGEVARQFSQGVTQLRSSDQQQRDAAAGTLMSGSTTAAGVGLGGLNGVLGLANAGLTSSMIPQQLLAQILGGPTTLTDSMSYGTSTATSSSKGKSAGFNFATQGAFGG
jgi:hypothetical protein